MPSTLASSIVLFSCKMDPSARSPWMIAGWHKPSLFEIRYAQHVPSPSSNSPIHISLQLPVKHTSGHVCSICTFKQNCAQIPSLQVTQALTPATTRSLCEARGTVCYVMKARDLFTSSGFKLQKKKACFYLPVYSIPVHNHVLCTLLYCVLTSSISPSTFPAA